MATTAAVNQVNQLVEPIMVEFPYIYHKAVKQL